MLCYAMLCYAMLCYAMLCYAMLCYAMLCYAMLCYAMLVCYTNIMLCVVIEFCWGVANKLQVVLLSVLFNYGSRKHQLVHSATQAWEAL